MERDFQLRVQTQVTVAEHVHGESEVTDLGRSLELHLEGLDVESGLAGLVEQGFVERGEGEGRHGHLALLGVRQEDVPPGRVVAGQVRRVSQGRLDGLLAVVLLALAVAVLAAHECVEVVLVGVDVFQIRGAGFRHVGVAGRNKSGLHDELHQTAWRDDLLAHDLEEGPGDFQCGELLGDGDGGGVLGFGEKTGADGEATAFGFRQAHELLHAVVFLGILALDRLGDLVGEVRQLQERRRPGSDGLDQVLRRSVRSQDGTDVTESERDGGECFVQGKRCGSGFVLFCTGMSIY